MSKKKMWINPRRRFEGAATLYTLGKGSWRLGRDYAGAVSRQEGWVPEIGAGPANDSSAKPRQGHFGNPCPVTEPPAEPTQPCPLTGLLTPAAGSGVGATRHDDHGDRIRNPSHWRKPHDSLTTADVYSRRTDSSCPQAKVSLGTLCW